MANQHHVRRFLFHRHHPSNPCSTLSLLRQQSPSFRFLSISKNVIISQKQQTKKVDELTTPLNSLQQQRQQSTKLDDALLEREIDQCYNQLDLSFENAQEAFKSKTNFDLVRALFVFRCCQFDWLVKNNQRLLHLLRNILGLGLFKRVLKSTFYGHFVAGETLDEVSKTVEKLHRFGVKSILDYSVEQDISPKEAQEKAVEGIVKKARVPEALDVLADEQKMAKAEEKSLIKPEKTHQQYSVHKQFGDRREHVVSARTYFYSGESECDKNAEIFCKCIDSTSEATKGQGFTVVKLTALGRPRLLIRLTEAIAQMENLFKVLTGSNWENLVMSRLTEAQLIGRLQEFGVKTDSAAVRDWFKQVDFDADGLVDFFDWGKLLDLEKQAGARGLNEMFQILNIKTGRLEPLILSLSEQEMNECANMMGRLNRIAEYALSKGVRLMVDAEQTYFQPAISRVTVALMRRYNKERGQILNTYQAYLRSALTNLQVDLNLARRDNFHFGCKLVRGAYMEQERKRAATIGYDDPICPSHEATSEMYHRCLDAIVDEWALRGGRGGVSVMVASHNLDTVRYSVELMKQRRIVPSERVLCFGQLYGMCDVVSFSLGQAGYSVYKYIPWGPVEGVLPYLSRRALENGSMLKNVNKERRLLWAELKRRLGSGKFFYRPPEKGGLPTQAGEMAQTETTRMDAARMEKTTIL